MELIYLWVEEYKNIRKQGFNFSGRYRCEYDDLKNELTLEKKDDYVSIFPPNINVTAIVGENGSGKSNILKLLHNQLRIWGGKSFAIFINENNEKFYLCDEVGKYLFLNDFKQLSDNNTADFPFFEYSFTYDMDLDYKYTNIYPKKQINSVKGVVHIVKELFRNQKNILLNYFDFKQARQLNKFESFFMPRTINIFFNSTTIKPNEHFPKLLKNAELELKNLKQSIIDNQTSKEFVDTIKTIRNLLADTKSYEESSSPFDFINPKAEFELGNNDDSEEEYVNLWHSSFNNNIDIFALSKIKAIRRVKANEEWITESDFHVFSFDITELNKYAIEIIMASFSSYQFTVQLCDINDRALDSLSFGEQQLLFILNQLYSLKNNLISGVELIKYQNREYEWENNQHIESYVVLLDEVDIGWHPNWQRKAISYMCDFLALLPNKKFHLIFATHSPFILSDIPRRSVIFLEDGKQVYPDINSFGANIHTLLSHGFFMEDGLMGEYAKSKINELIDYLNGKDSPIQDDEEAQKYIHIIGEPILKKQLQRMLDSKRLSKVDRIDEIERNILSLREELERLKSK